MKKEKQLKIKENDVFKVAWKKREWGDQKNWAFEGLLVALKFGGEIRLYDTFWGIGDTNGKSFSFEEMLDLFDITYYCNLDDLKEIEKYETNYFRDEDIYYLHWQHSCVESCRKYYIKEAQKNKEKMLEVINEKIDKTEREIVSLVKDFGQLNTTKNEIENNNLDVYL